MPPVCRIHKTLRMFPAMAAGITDRLWSLEDVVAKIDAMATAPKPHRHYKKRTAQLQDDRGPPGEISRFRPRAHA